MLSGASALRRYSARCGSTPRVGRHGAAGADGADGADGDCGRLPIRTEESAGAAGVATAADGRATQEEQEYVMSSQSDFAAPSAAGPSGTSSSGAVPPDASPSGVGLPGTSAAGANPSVTSSGTGPSGARTSCAVGERRDELAPWMRINLLGEHHRSALRDVYKFECARVVAARMECPDAPLKVAWDFSQLPLFYDPEELREFLNSPAMDSILHLKGLDCMAPDWFVDTTLERLSEHLLELHMKEARPRQMELVANMRRIRRLSVRRNLVSLYRDPSSALPPQLEELELVGFGQADLLEIDTLPRLHRLSLHYLVPPPPGSPLFLFGENKTPADDDVRQRPGGLQWLSVGCEKPELVMSLVTRHATTLRVLAVATSTHANLRCRHAPGFTIERLADALAACGLRELRVLLLLRHVRGLRDGVRELDHDADDCDVQLAAIRERLSRGRSEGGGGDEAGRREGKVVDGEEEDGVAADGRGDAGGKKGEEGAVRVPVVLCSFCDADVAMDFHGAEPMALEP